LEKEKEYIAEFTFGVDSDTLDSTGNLVQGGHVPDEMEISDVLPTFFGDIMQVPPKYSAKNVNGRRGYDLARAGIEFELAPKKVHIYGMELLGKKEDTVDTFLVKIRCGGGTYIRSLGRDIAAALGTKAVMSALRRTQSGVFTLQNAVPFDFFMQDPAIEDMEKYLIPTDSVLPFERLNLTEKGTMRILQGNFVSVDVADGLYKIYDGESFYGLAEVTEGKAKAKTKLC
jgi:tRNA pseudouridine55 synthase